MPIQYPDFRVVESWYVWRKMLRFAGVHTLVPPPSPDSGKEKNEFP